MSSSTRAVTLDQTWQVLMLDVDIVGVLTLWPQMLGLLYLRKIVINALLISLLEYD